MGQRLTYDEALTRFIESTFTEWTETLRSTLEHRMRTLGRIPSNEEVRELVRVKRGPEIYIVDGDSPRVGHCGSILHVEYMANVRRVLRALLRYRTTLVEAKRRCEAAMRSGDARRRCEAAMRGGDARRRCEAAMRRVTCSVKRSGRGTHFYAEYLGCSSVTVLC